jgi:hypothetical protein
LLHPLNVKYNRNKNYCQEKEEGQIVFLSKGRFAGIRKIVLRKLRQPLNKFIDFYTEKFYYEKGVIHYNFQSRKRDRSEYRKITKIVKRKREHKTGI